MSEQNVNAPDFITHHSYIKDLSFEYPNPMLSGDDDTKISVSTNVSNQKIGDNAYEALLELNVEAKGKDDAPIFILEVVYGSIISIENQSLSENNIEEIVMINAPQYMFPYVRSIISQTLQNGGLPPFYLNHMDFRELYNNQNKQ
jgi:preprotein translocase subunit SecB